MMFIEIFIDLFMTAKRRGGWPFQNFPLIQAPQIEKEIEHCQKVSRMYLDIGDVSGEKTWVAIEGIWRCHLYTIYYSRIQKVKYASLLTLGWATFYFCL